MKLRISDRHDRNRDFPLRVVSHILTHTANAGRRRRPSTIKAQNVRSRPRRDTSFQSFHPMLKTPTFGFRCTVPRSCVYTRVYLLLQPRYVHRNTWKTPSTTGSQHRVFERRCTRIKWPSEGDKLRGEQIQPVKMAGEIQRKILPRSPWNDHWIFNILKRPHEICKYESRKLQS